MDSPSFPKFRNLEVGTIVYCLDIGYATVITVNKEDDYICLKAQYKRDASGLELFRDCKFDGRYCSEDENPMVYWVNPGLIHNN